MGASSFAFHLRGEYNSKGWVLDIAMGWLVLIYMACLLAFVCLRLIRVSRNTSRLLVHVLFAGLVTVAWTRFDDVYHIQTLIMVAGGSVIATLFACVHMHRERMLRGARGVVRAGVDVAMLLWLLVAATLVQCQMLGSGCADQREYDLSHGQWHFLLSVALGLTHRRVINQVASVDDTLNSTNRRTDSNRVVDARCPHGRGAVRVRANRGRVEGEFT